MYVKWICVNWGCRSGARFDWSLSEVWVRFERSLSKVLAKFERDLTDVWLMFERGLNKFWTRFEQGLNKVWMRFEQDLIKVWLKFGRGLSDIMLLYYAFSMQTQQPDIINPIQYNSGNLEIAGLWLVELCPLNPIKKVRSYSIVNCLSLNSLASFISWKIIKT